MSRLSRTRKLSLGDHRNRIEQSEVELAQRIERRDQDIRAWQGNGPDLLSTAEICEATGLAECDVLSILLGGTP